MIPTARGFPIPYFTFKVAWSILDCARRTSTFLSCAFREQEDGQATPPHFQHPASERPFGGPDIFPVHDHRPAPSQRYLRR